MTMLASLDAHEAALLRVPLTRLRLPKKTEILEHAGHRTIGAVYCAHRSGQLLSIPSIGKSTVDEIERRFALLADVIAQGGGVINWERYALALGHDLVPRHEITSGPQFLGAFAEVIDAVIRYHQSPIEQLILTERLVRHPGDRLTLDELGQRAEPRPITRERVRQLEKGLITGLSNALLFDDYRELPIHFRTSFAERWKAAAERFGAESKISFGDFMRGLEEVWDVPAHELLPHLPLITSILTSRATLPPQLREGLRLHPRLYCYLEAALLECPVGWLALGRTSAGLIERGMETIGDLVSAARAATLPPAGTKAGDACRRALNALAEALGESGEVSWARFGELMGLVAVPPADRSTAEEFLSSLNQDLGEIVRITGTSGRAADIFRLRTCVPRPQRPTLKEIAKLLGGHGSTIKREETELLESLHAQLVAHDFSLSRVMFPPRFLAWWRSAGETFGRSGSAYGEFCASLAAEWRLPLSLIEQNSEGLWAVLARYPNGRRAPIRRAVSPVEATEFTGGTILLRGFRRAH